ncbi:MAG: hypothetical protein ACREA4_10145, partial [Nitrososphaera sp.]
QPRLPGSTHSTGRVNQSRHKELLTSPTEQDLLPTRRAQGHDISPIFLDGTSIGDANFNLLS